MLFVGHLVESKRQSSTIKSYISAIKTVLRGDGVDINEDRYLLNSLTKACKLHSDTLSIRLPIQKGLLTLILSQTSHHFQIQPYLASLYRAIFSSCNYGLLRISEAALSKHTVKAMDIHIGRNKGKLKFILRSSKNSLQK